MVCNSWCLESEKKKLGTLIMNIQYYNTYILVHVQESVIAGFLLQGKKMKYHQKILRQQTGKQKLKRSKFWQNKTKQKPPKNPTKQKQQQNPISFSESCLQC